MKLNKFVILIIAMLILPSNILAVVDASKSYEAGIDNYQKGNFKKAIQLIEQSIEAGLTSDERIDAYQLLYFSSYLINNFEKATFYQDKCKNIIPNFDVIVLIPFTFEIKIIDEKYNTSSSLKNIPQEDTIVWVRDKYSKLPFVVKKRGIEISKYMSNATINLDNQYNQLYLLIQLSNEGAVIFEKFTDQNTNRKSIFIHNDRVISSLGVQIQGKITNGQFRVTMNRYFTSNDLNKLYFDIKASNKK